MSQTSARQVGDWLIWFYNEHGDGITNLRLQKLLYYCQAWHLALRDGPLFKEEFEAWIHGPVISALYGEFKRFGPSPIHTTDPTDEVLPEPPLDDAAKSHVKEVLDAYGHLTAWQLERLTHQELPWLEARADVAIDAPCRHKISKDTMKAFYRKMMDEQESSHTAAKSKPTE